MPIEKKIIALVIFGILIAVLALFLPVTVINFTPIQYINASNITAIGAASTSDPYNMTNISELDNLNFSLVEGTTPWFINITFVNVTNFSFIESKTLYYSNVGAPTAHEVDLEIWCIPEGKFVDTTSLTSHDEWWFFSRHVPDSTHFIDNGNVTLRFNHSDNGNTNHRLRIDTARLVVMQQFEKVNINSTINYITQGGGGAGVSFNGNSVNLNGSLLFNGTFSNINDTKVNKSGDTMTGNLSMESGKLIMNRSEPWASSNLVSDGMIVSRNNGNITSVFRDIGAQFWYLHASSSSFGYVAGDFAGMIGYSIPQGGIGFAMRNSTPGINQTVWQSQWRSDLYFVPVEGEVALCVAPGNKTTSPACKLLIYSNYTVQIPGFAGSSGIDYVCSNRSTGEIFTQNGACT